MISFSKTKKNHMLLRQGLGYTVGEVTFSYFFFLQKRHNYCGGMGGGIIMWKIDMFKTSGRASFLIILFQFLQYYVFVVLSGDAFAPSPEKKIAYKVRRVQRSGIDTIKHHT